MPAAKNETERAQRRARVLELRAHEHLSHRAISERLKSEGVDVSHVTVREDIKQGLRESLEHDLACVDEIRKLGNMRTEWAAKVARDIIDATDDPEVKLKAIDRYLKAEERLAKSIGTDSPERVEVTDTELTADQVRDMAQRHFGKVTPSELTDVSDDETSKPE